ncbi:MAG: ribosome small subunit-dependent GTPase A [Candidatus Eisenbacteria bacterium]|nr:ribosome small subunit-dependent GTPase A [Candidatus Eisenbacteria bacterium]
MRCAWRRRGRRAEPDMTVQQGTVIAVRPRRARVRADGQEYDCELPQGLIRGPREQRTLLAVGDRVRFERLPSGGAVVRRLLPRTSKVSRVGSLRPRREQVIAANLTQLLALQAVAEPRFNARALDRLLVVGEAGNLRCAVVLNKIDLSGRAQITTALTPYRRAGYPILETSALTGEGLERLRGFLQDEVSILLGPSGVGKSSLLNRLIPGLTQSTRQISRSSGKGRHATSRVDHLDFPGGGVVLDTPGLRAVQPWTTAPALAGCFPEMRDHLDRCRFPDCLHRAEPDCAVRGAVDAGAVDRQRYEAYLRILASLLEEAG